MRSFYCQFSGAYKHCHFPARTFVTTISSAFVGRISMLCLYYTKSEYSHSKKRPLHLMCVFIGVAIHDIQRLRLMTVNALLCATHLSFAITQFTTIQLRWNVYCSHILYTYIYKCCVSLVRVTKWRRSFSSALLNSTANYK